MENQTNDAIASVMTDEFKAELVRRNNVLRTLNYQEESVKSRIIDLNKEIEELTNKKLNIEKELSPLRDSLENEYKQKNESFEITKSSVTKSLDNSTKELENRIISHETSVKSHVDNVQEFNKEKEAFKSQRLEVSGALKELSVQFNEFIQEAIHSIEGS